MRSVTTAMTLTAEPGFRMGAVLGRGFRILRRNLGAFWVLCAIVVSPPFALIVILGDVRQEQFWDLAYAGIAAAILGTVLAYIATAALVYGTVQQLRGQTIGIGACIGRGLATMLPVLGVALLAGILVILGLAVLVVPGILLMVMLWVVVPVAVVERPGVVASLRRSADLTKGFRWQILGILALLLVIEVAAATAVKVFIGQVFVALGGGAAGWWAGVAVDWVLEAFFTALAAVIGAVGYHDLRVAKEGLDTEQIAAVFD